MMMSEHSTSWDSREKKLDDVDNEEDEDEIGTPVDDDSMIFCVICHDKSDFVLDGDSLCQDHYVNKLESIIEHWKHCKNK